ncbi:electron transfer flavoprotein subunit alpha/FixB family protein [Bacillus sp. B1-b2]|uniref:electron transfer flavoprotein subunit alpha/FixB family protein n=1 Tax=Bacillus sp. B1-b2 TaxID=2653201 RepID=UPI00186A0BF2|nr:electron transfer flavoprotein subunit alpha/FixB family protein [Bacillus sp. B1-b2]
MAKERILIFGEVYHNSIKSITLECIDAIKHLKRKAELIVLLSGEDVKKHAEELSYYPIDKIITVESPFLSRFSIETWNNMVESVIENLEPTIIVFGHTEIGRSITPYISERLNIPLFSNVETLEMKENKLQITRPAFSGKLTEYLQIEETPYILTLKPKVWSSISKMENKKSQVIAMNVEIEKPVFSLSRLVQSEKEQSNLTDAKIIVGAGRGVETKEGFELVEQLAQKLGGAVGVSRGAVELGVTDSSIQIGQTGKTVAPDIYIACGISGAIQHLIGVKSAKTIIAINKDPHSPIFEYADYCLVGDIFDVIPALIKEWNQESME